MINSSYRKHNTANVGVFGFVLFCFVFVVVCVVVVVVVFFWGGLFYIICSSNNCGVLLIICFALTWSYFWELG